MGTYVTRYETKNGKTRRVPSQQGKERKQAPAEANAAGGKTGQAAGPAKQGEKP